MPETNKQDQIEELLTRGVENIYPSREALETVLRQGKKLRLYQGFDPTGTQLHLGHMVGLRKLRQFQDLGHEVIFLIGDGTGQAGDPSGKMKFRGRFMSKEELRANARQYRKQAGRVLRFKGENPVKILYNSRWLNKLKLLDLLEIAQNFTLQQMIERDMYQVRLKAGEPVSLREFLYPLFQGYDSVFMDVDLELGGTDQTFNMLAGRALMKAMKGKEKFVMTTPLLIDTQGTKIGKTEGNVIALDDPPAELFSKIMSLGDEAIIPCFELLTDVPKAQIERMKQEMQQGQNPMLFKKQLAFQLTERLNRRERAEYAEREFNRVFKEKEVPESIPAVEIPSPDINLIDFLVRVNLAESKAQARSLVKDGAVQKMIGAKFSRLELKPSSPFKVNDGDVFKVGRKIIQIRLKA